MSTFHSRSVLANDLSNLEAALGRDRRLPESLELLQESRDLCDELVGEPHSEP